MIIVNIIKHHFIASKQAGYAIFINYIIALFHGLFYDGKTEMDRKLYEVRTRKILMYSNIVASALNLGVCGLAAYRGNYKSAYENLDLGGIGKMLKDAENGDVVAMFNLGQVFEYGRLGKNEDHYAARNWYRKAAKNGFVPAQYKLEDMERIIKEEERREDILKRFEVDKEAAERLYNEAWRYEHGIDVPEDLERAKELYRISALKGNQNAKSRLNFLTRIS